MGIFVERVTGIESALSAWEAAGAFWPTSSIYGRDPGYNILIALSLHFWVENWVENRRYLESVEAGAT